MKSVMHFAAINHVHKMNSPQLPRLVCRIRFKQACITEPILKMRRR